jgi:hypothetical protein
LLKTWAEEGRRHGGLIFVDGEVNFSAKESPVLPAQERDVLGVGVETVGIDAGQAATFDPPFQNPYLIHGSGRQVWAGGSVES